MIKSTIKVDPKDSQKFGKVLSEALAVCASIVEDEFIDLLHNAPQRYGNYVANFSIGTGDRIGRSGGDIYFPTNTKPQDWYVRGDIPAIRIAMERNNNLLEKLNIYVNRVPVFGPTIIVYNRLSYSDAVEGYSKAELREANAGGEHALMQAKVKIQARFSKTIIAGSAEWDQLVTKARVL